MPLEPRKAQCGNQVAQAVTPFRAAKEPRGTNGSPKSVVRQQLDGLIRRANSNCLCLRCGKLRRPAGFSRRVSI
jgi:hypothetical protein